MWHVAPLATQAVNVETSAVLDTLLQSVLLALLTLQGASPRLPPVDPGATVVPPLTLREPADAGWVRVPEHVAPVISARAALVVDQRTGAVLYALRPGSRVAIASLTKIMSALVVLDQATDLDRLVTVPADANSLEGTRSWLVIGDQYRVRDLLSALLISSAADATLSLADAIGGSRDGFVRLMNLRATKLGLTGVSFTNPVGMDAPGNYGTAYDVAALLTELWKSPLARDALGQRKRSITSAGGRKALLESTNDLLGADGYVILGGKTGTTDEAGQAFATVGSVVDGRPTIVVVLGSTDRFRDTRVLLAWAAVAWHPPPT